MDDKGIRDQLIAALRGGQAYDAIEHILAEVPAEGRFRIPEGGERSAWQIVEHMRISLEDLTSYSDNANGAYQERKWPDEYWPANPSNRTEEEWDSSIASLLSARDGFELLLQERDLTTPFPWSKEGHNLLREALLAIDHGGYHSGELVELSRWLSADLSN